MSTRTRCFDLGSAAHHDSRSAYDFVADRCGQDVADYWGTRSARRMSTKRVRDEHGCTVRAHEIAAAPHGRLRRTKGGMSALPEVPVSEGVLSP